MRCCRYNSHDGSFETDNIYHTIDQERKICVVCVTRVTSNRGPTFHFSKSLLLGGLCCVSCQKCFKISYYHYCFIHWLTIADRCRQLHTHLGPHLWVWPNDRDQSRCLHRCKGWSGDISLEAQANFQWDRQSTAWRCDFPWIVESCKTKRIQEQPSEEFQDGVQDQVSLIPSCRFGEECNEEASQSSRNWNPSADFCTAKRHWQHADGSVWDCRDWQRWFQLFHIYFSTWLPMDMLLNLHEMTYVFTLLCYLIYFFHDFFFPPVIVITADDFEQLAEAKYFRSHMEAVSWIARGHSYGVSRFHYSKQFFTASRYAEIFNCFLHAHFLTNKSFQDN